MSSPPRRRAIVALTLSVGTLVALGASCSAPRPERVGTSSSALSTGLVISQVYGGGGNSGSTYWNDFVEIFNRGSTSVSLSGLSVQYGSAGSIGPFGGVTVLSASTVGPGQYYLLELAAGGTTTGIPLPAPDQANTAINMSATAGKVALVNGTTAITCVEGSCDPSVIDLVGYGSTANAWEGSAPATTAPSSVYSVQRKGAGCTETDDNLSDFENPALSVNPRNSASTANPCGGSDAGLDGGAAPDVSAGTDVTTGGDTSTDAGSPTDTGVDTGHPSDAGGDVAIGNTNGLVISQAYGGGGNSSAAFSNDFVELFNRGASDVDLGGLSLQYASSHGSFQASNVTVLESASIAPGHYFLIQLAAGGGGGSALPAPDQTNPTTNLSDSTGKVAVVLGTAAVLCGATDAGCSPADFVDLVGYGTGASQFEGSGPAAGPTTNSEAVVRKLGGCVDTNDNAGDFDNPAIAAAPRNSASPVNDCAISTDGGVADGVSPGEDAGATDAAEPDTSTGTPDASPGLDASTGGGDSGNAPGEDSGDASTSPPPSSGGCSCRSSGSGSEESPYFSAFGIVATAVAFGRSRRRRLPNAR